MFRANKWFHEHRRLVGINAEVTSDASCQRDGHIAREVTDRFIQDGFRTTGWRRPVLSFLPLVRSHQSRVPGFRPWVVFVRTMDPGQIFDMNAEANALRFPLADRPVQENAEMGLMVSLELSLLEKTLSELQTRMMSDQSICRRGTRRNLRPALILFEEPSIDNLPRAR